MARKKTPANRSTLSGTSKRMRAESDATYQQKSQPNDDAIWNACRVSQDVAASCRAQDAARLESAALELGHFQLNENGQWVHLCRDCRQTVTLRITVNSDVRASSSGQTTCPKVPRIQQWLRDNGFQS